MLLKRLCILLLLAPITAFGSVAYVQSAKATPAATSGTLAFPSNVTSGDLLIVAIGGFTVSGPSTPTDTISSSYKLVTSVADLTGGANSYVWIWVAKAGSSAANTVSFSGVSANNTLVAIEEWSGVAQTSYLGSNNFTASTTTWSITNTGTPLTDQSGVAVLFASQTTVSSTTFSISGGTVRQQGSPTGGATVALGDIAMAQQTAAGTLTLTMTVANSVQGTMTGLYLGPVASGGTTAANSGYAQ